MKIDFQSRGDFKKLDSWLRSVASRDPTPALKRIAEDGVTSLKNSTPKDTGETANGWESRIERTPQGADISWVNVAHPDLSVNVAMIIDQGHGTRNGGYVQPRPFIKESMDNIWKTASDKIEKELIR